MKVRQRAFTILAAVVVFVLAGATAALANAVSFSSNDGIGNAGVTKHARDGGYVKGAILSTTGNKVYIGGKIVYKNNTDPTCRASQETTSTSGVSVAQWCIVPIQIGTYDGMQFRVCRARTGLPDGCGSWSAKSKE